MNEKLIKTLYKVYTTYGVVPVLSRIQAGQAHEKETIACLVVCMDCQYYSLDEEEVLEELERYSTWQRELIRI